MRKGQRTRACRKIVDGKAYCKKCETWLKIESFHKRSSAAELGQVLPDGTTNVQQFCKACSKVRHAANNRNWKPRRPIINGMVYCPKCRKMVRIQEYYKRSSKIKRGDPLPNGTMNLQQFCKSCTKAVVHRTKYLKESRKRGMNWLIAQIEKTRSRLKHQEAALTVLMDRNYKKTEGLGDS